MELGKQFSFLFLDVLDFSTFADQLLWDFLDLFDDEAFLLGALLELIGESHVFGLHRSQQDQLFEQKNQLQLGAL